MLKLFAFIGIMTTLLFFTFIFSTILAQKEKKYQMLEDMEPEN